MRVVFQQYLMSDKNLKQLKHSKHEKNYRSNIGNSVNQIICRVKLRSEKKWKIKCKANKESKFTLLLLFLINQNNLLVTRNFPMEKAMAPHSSTLAWKIPWAEEPGGLQSMGLWRVRHDWATWLSLFTFMHWRRKWQPTPVFLPGESQGWGSLVGCRLWGRTESDTTEAT